MTITREIARQRTILRCNTGAHLYGTATEDSDTDVVGIFIPPKEYVVGFYRCDQVDASVKMSTTQGNQAGDVDETLYALPKFIKLAADCNPNIIEILFAPTLEVRPLGVYLQEHAHLFVSRQAETRFLGYAKSQEHKLQRPCGDSGEKRRGYIEKYGYDVKAASHLLRLLDEGMQLLLTGRIRFPLTSADTLKEVKLGLVPWEKFQGELLPRYYRWFDEAVDARRLPVNVDLAKLNELQMELLERYWREESGDWNG